MTNRHRSFKNSIKLTGLIHYTVCRTKRDDLVEAALVQRFKMSKRYAPAQQNISAHQANVHPCETSVAGVTSQFSDKP